MELELKNGFTEMNLSEMMEIDGGNAENVARTIGQAVGYVAGAVYNTMEFIWKVCTML